VKSIRRIAIIFAVLSSVYWIAISGFISMIWTVAEINVAPYWLVALFNFVPAAIYAVAALKFCHWFARRILRQAKNELSHNVQKNTNSQS
jgi:membrane protein implicated in regulation of membrane protease activity